MNAEVLVDNVEDILRGITIPSPPQILADLQLELAMPDPDLGQMADLISRDAGIAGGVLKTANSPFYGFSSRVTSIQQAVMLLGIKTVVNIVNTLCLRNELLAKEGLPDIAVEILNRFWDSSTDVARAMTIIARHSVDANQEQAYITGLFHNSGSRC